MIDRALAVAAGLLLLAGCAWSAGFDGWLRDARSASPPHASADASADAPADAIVVLTGGADRIGTALRLLADGRAPALLISGVGRGSELSDLVPGDASGLADRITLGRTATSTLGNAGETAAWARSRGVRRLIVVTAGYHMRRALLEIARALPEATLLPVNVQPPVLRGRADGRHLLASEYDKYLAVRLGLSRFWNRP